VLGEAFAPRAAITVRAAFLRMSPNLVGGPRSRARPSPPPLASHLVGRLVLAEAGVWRKRLSAEEPAWLRQSPISTQSRSSSFNGNPGY
jgi:hypothetical protein